MHAPTIPVAACAQSVCDVARSPSVWDAARAPSVWDAAHTHATQDSTHVQSICDAALVPTVWGATHAQSVWDATHAHSVRDAALILTVHALRRSTARERQGPSCHPFPQSGTWGCLPPLPLICPCIQPVHDNVLFKAYSYLSSQRGVCIWKHPDTLVWLLLKGKSESHCSVQFCLWPHPPLPCGP